MAVLAALVSAFTAAGSAAAASPSDTLGVYRGSGAPDRVAAFEGWNGGQRTAFALDFLAMDSWDTITYPDWWASQWSGSTQRIVYSIPLLPRSGGTLAQGATGAYNGSFESLARTLIRHGQGNAVLRLGWEFNGNWYPWAAQKDPAGFVAYWRQVVTAIRAVPGAQFAIDWTPVLGTGGIAPDRVYPGDAYVDVIGLDAYDQSWYPNWTDPAARWRSLVEQPYGLQWHRDFAAAHGKPVSFPEWGLTIRPDGHGGGDNAYYVQHMHDWIAAGNVLYHCYFEFDADDGRHSMMGGQFPVGAAEFRRLFGPDGAQAQGAAPASPGAPGRAGAPASASGAAPSARHATPVRARRSSSLRRLARVHLTRVRSGAARIRIAGRVRRARGGRVRLELRIKRASRWHVVGVRSAAVLRDGRFAAAVRRPAARRLTLVASYRGLRSTAARAVVRRR